MSAEDSYAAHEVMLVYDGFDRDREGLRDALTSTGNSFFCIRGAAEWEDPDEVHYAGVYEHGVYNRESTIVGGRHGAEMMLEIARFWSSIAHLNYDRGRWGIHGVMGPGGFHEKYPDASEGGLRNNAYTNVMVASICETAQRVLELLPATRREVLRARIGLRDEEISRWRAISRRMFVPFHGDGIISQFAGYEQQVVCELRGGESATFTIARRLQPRICA